MPAYSHALCITHKHTRVCCTCHGLEVLSYCQHPSTCFMRRTPQLKLVHWS